MAIRKWMTKIGYLPGSRRQKVFVRKLPLAAVAFLCASGFLSADLTTGVRVLPSVAIPVGDTLFKQGYGIAAAFDVMPAPWFGFFAEGDYLSLGLDNVDGLTIYGGNLGAGLVWRPTDRVSVRGDLMGGVYKATRTGVDVSGVSAGARLSGNYYLRPSVMASIHAGYTQYAYTPSPFANTVSVGAGITIDLGEAFGKKTRVKVEPESQDPVFPVLFSWYDDNKFAVVSVKNSEPNAITDVTTSFYLEQFMGQPKVCSVSKRLKPGESVEVPLRAFFRESMLDLTERIDAEGTIIVEYRSLGAKRRAEIPFTIPVYNRNAMSWEDDRRAAAFVSSKDPAALWFSKYSASIVRDRYREGINDNIQYAIGVFSALNAYGINYVVDPSSAYADNAGSGVSIDFLQFPYQTLTYRGGDCDDLSILYCSLLEASGIDTAFITIPGHIFMAFDSGMTEAEARANFYDPSILIYRDGHAWVPVEITLTKENFTKAWRVGAKEWSDADAKGKANLYPMRESWKIYHPVSVPGAATRFSLPDEQKTALIFTDSLDRFVAKEIKPQVDAYKAELARHDTAETRNLLGVLYGHYGMLNDAWAQFKIAADRGYTHAIVNLGNVAFLDQDYEGSLGYYKKGLDRDPSNNIALLGAARCYYELDEFMRSDTLYAELGTRDAALGKRYSYLSSFIDTEGRAWSLSERLHTTAWSLPKGLDPVVHADDGRARDAALEDGLAPRGSLVEQTSLVITDDTGNPKIVALPMAEAAADPRKVNPRAVRAGSGDIILPKATKVPLSSGTGPEGDQPPKKQGTEPPATATPVSAPVAEPAQSEAPKEPQDVAPESEPVAKPVAESESSPDAVETPAATEEAEKPAVTEKRAENTEPVANDADKQVTATEPRVEPAAPPAAAEAPAAKEAPHATEAPAAKEVPVVDDAMPVAHDIPVTSAEPPVATVKVAEKTATPKETPIKAPKASATAKDVPATAKADDTVHEVAKADLTASENTITPEATRNQEKTEPNAEGGFGKKRIFIVSLIVGLVAVAAACMHIALKRRSLSSGEGRRKKK
jgi:tetratricopeptide (TPR) repeat protein